MRTLSLASPPRRGASHASGASAHARYGDRLTRLTDDVALAVVASATGVGDGWTRTYGRFDPDRAPYATLVYERLAAHPPRQRIVRVEVHDEAPTFRVGALATDAALPTLAAVLAAEPTAHVVRYRPGRRCTVRVGADGAARYGKIFPDGEGALIHEDAVALWNVASSLGFRVARPLAYDGARRVAWQHAVPGESGASRLFGAGGAAVARRMGEAVASLGRAPLAPRLVTDARWQLERSARYAAEIGTRVPALAADAARLVATLRRTHDALGTRPLRPIHGAPHPSQWLVDGDALGLVDFDRLAAGDPELDVATFVAELDFEDATALPVDRLAGEFVAGFEAVGGPLDARLLAAYRAHKRLAKALRSARAPRPDGDVRAARHLARAAECLEVAP